MTRQRKEIQKEMDALYAQEQAEYEMGCGFGSEEISRAFQPEWDRLNEKMAATYGMTAEQYETMGYEVQDRLYEAGVIPFN
jgi:hypothetical protein